MAYRDQKGRFIPQKMQAEKALETDNGTNYKISDNYQGTSSNATATLIEPNPYWKGNFEPKDPPKLPETGEKPKFVNVADKFSKK